MKYIVSDIHGMKNMLKEVIEKINFNKDDDLYILGDVIDRGDDGIDILKWCCYHHLKNNNVHLILGDHECMMLNAIGCPVDNNDPTLKNEDLFDLWYHNGGRVTHDTWKRLDPKEQNILINYLKSCSFGETLEIAGMKYYLAHACHPEIVKRFIDDKSQILHYAVWSRNLGAIDDALNENECAIFGHTMVEYIYPKVKDGIIKVDNLIAIDCGCAAAANGLSYGRLGCLTINDNGELGKVYSSRND